MKRTICVEVDTNEYSIDDLIAELLSRKSSLSENHRASIRNLVGYSGDCGDLVNYGGGIVIGRKVVYDIENLSDVMAVEEFVKERKSL